MKLAFSVCAGTAGLLGLIYVGLLVNGLILHLVMVFERTFLR